MRKLFLAGVVFTGLTTSATALEIEMREPIVVAHIDISTQKIHVSVHGKELYTWKVSTGAAGHRTPTGTFGPYRVHRYWWSRQYDMAPMHYALFFHRGYAVHATDATGTLGIPASHGCVRLHPTNAATLFKLVQQHGSVRTRISLSGDWRVAERNLGKLPVTRRPAVAGYQRRKIRSFAQFGN